MARAGQVRWQGPWRWEWGAALGLVAVVAAGVAAEETPPGAPPGAPTAAPALHDLRSALEPIRVKHGVPALAGAIVTRDGVVAIGATGVRAHGAATPVEASDIWHLGSCTKAMTGTLVAVFVERGAIGWDTTLGEVFPELREFMHESFRGVTVAQMLSHRAGIPGALTPGQWKILLAPGDPLQLKRLRMVRSVTDEAPVSEPGSKFEYSNQGYILVGAMLERRTGKLWETLMREELFAPLGMRSAGFGPPGAADAIDQPRGHKGDDAARRPLYHDNPPALGPAGTVHASLEDWGRFVAFHLRGAEGASEKAGEEGTAAGLALRAETFAAMHTPADGFSYALGWGTARRGWAGGVALTHAGSNTMWYAVVWAAPKRDFAVLVATNLGTAPAPKACDEVAGELIRLHGERAKAAEGR